MGILIFQINSTKRCDHRQEKSAYHTDNLSSAERFTTW